MEFVDVKDLRKIVSRCRESKEPLPIALALYVMVRVLDALAYAHRKKDEQDRELNLVHRDVSPQNVLVSYEGEVKVIDFGLAKSSLSLGRTNPAMILGKFFYMSPEQARHQSVDRRSDLYAVGICLWELLVGKNPFDDVPQGELMRKVAIPTIASPRELRPDLPQSGEAVVMKALAIDPAERFASAEEMRGRLTAAMLEVDAGAGPEALASWMRERFVREYESERKAIASLARVKVQAEEAPEPPKRRQTVDDDGEFGPTTRVSGEELAKRLASRDLTPAGEEDANYARTFVGAEPKPPARPQKVVPLRAAPVLVSDPAPPAFAEPPKQEPQRPSSPRLVPIIDRTGPAVRAKQESELPVVPGVSLEPAPVRKPASRPVATAEKPSEPKGRASLLIAGGALLLAAFGVVAFLLLGTPEPELSRDAVPLPVPSAEALAAPVPVAPPDPEPAQVEPPPEEPVPLAPLVPKPAPKPKQVRTSPPPVEPQPEPNRLPPPKLDARAEKKRIELVQLFQELDANFERLRATHSCERIGRLCTHLRKQVSEKYQLAIDDPEKYAELEQLLGDYARLQSVRRRELGISASP